MYQQINNMVSLNVKAVKFVIQGKRQISHVPVLKGFVLKKALKIMLTSMVESLIKLCLRY